MDGDLDGDGVVTTHELNVAVKAELEREKLQRLAGVSSKRVEEDLGVEVGIDIATTAHTCLWAICYR